MHPVKDLTRMVSMPFKALAVVGLCWTINAMTFQGRWWVQWVALGMGIVTVLALARGLRTLLVLVLAWWVGRWLWRRHGPAARQRFDAWMAGQGAEWPTQPGAAAQVLRALGLAARSPAGQAAAEPGAWRH